MHIAFFAEYDMEQSMNKPPVLATGNPQSLDEILDAGRDPRGSTRHDGWTPDRICTFLMALAETGSVTASAEAAGMSVASAYNLRKRVQGRGFHYAWEGALQIAKRKIADGLVERAIHGSVDRVMRDGVVVAERHRFDNRLCLATLRRLDERLSSDHEDSEAVRIVTEEFEAFSRIIAEGGAGAARFIYDRRSFGNWGRAERLLDRLEKPDPIVPGRGESSEGGAQS